VSSSGDAEWGLMGRGGFFVERDSYAIALAAVTGLEGVTRWGLFLMRGVHLFGVHSLWQSGGTSLTERLSTHSSRSHMGRACSVLISWDVSDALSKELDSNLFR
jgi:hypothetical protein